MLLRIPSTIRYNHHGKINANEYGAEHHTQLYSVYAE
jgi:hypothetical protein